jgi:hypothetical protein
MTDKEQEIIDNLLKNPKIIKAMKGLLKPLEKEGDSLTIIAGDKLK